MPQTTSSTLKAEVHWRHRPHNTMQASAEIAGLSVASVYRFANEGKLVLRRLGGRTLVDTSSLIALIESAEDWTPSKQTKTACEARSAAAERQRA